MKPLSLLQRDIFGQIGAKDLIIISRQLATMIKAGVPIVQSLRMIIRQIKKETARRMITQIIQDIEGGSSLSRALTRYPHVFSPFYVSVVRAGEASGRLTYALNALADYQEQNYLFIRKIRAALSYPGLILIAIVIVVIVVFTVIMPQLVNIFADADVELPFATRLVIGVANFFQAYWLIISLVGVVLALIARSYFKTPDGRYVASTLVLHLPVLKNLFSKIYLTRLTSILHTLFDSDVPVLESLRLAEQSIGNRVYQRILRDTATAVKDGVPISSVWEHEPFIPPLLTAVVGVGEKSGEVSQAFAEAKKFFQRDVEDTLNTITVLLEPLMVVVLGLGVGFVVAAVLLPIYNLVLVI